MNLEYITQESNRHLLLIFAGWSTDASAFAGLKAAGYDIAVLSDYNSLQMPDVGVYDEVVVMAWSLGVWAASVVLPDSSLPVTLAVAVNGTPWPVSDSRGIPESVFRATAESLTELSFRKFRRRMGGVSLPRGPRSIESLVSELRAIDESLRPVDRFVWDRAVVSDNDAIFPPAGQLAAWKGTRTAVTPVSGMHTPESWQSLVDAFVIDKTLVRQRFSRGITTYSDEASVQRRIASHLWELWQKHGTRPGLVLEVGFGDGTLTRLYAEKYKSARLMLWDMIDVSWPGADVRVCDGETEITCLDPESVDVIASASTIQWFNSPARFIDRASAALRPGGMLVLSTFGPETFRQLTAAGVVPLPYLSVEQWRASVPESMEILELHDGIVTRVFATPVDVIRHLRATGVNARRANVSLAGVLRDYPLAADGRASLTYQPIYMILRKK